MNKKTIIWIVALLLLVSFVSATVGNPSHFYDLDNDANDNIGDWNTTIIGTMNYTSTDCKNNTCAYFDGSTAISIGNRDFDNLSNFTYAFWLKPHMNNLPQNYRSGFLSKWVGGQYKSLYHNNSANLTLEFEINGGNLIKCAKTFVADTWYRVAVTTSLGNMTMWIDGQMFCSDTTGNSIPNEPSALYLGAGDSTPTYFWRGHMDDIVVWNYSLSEDDIILDNNSYPAVGAGSADYLNLSVVSVSNNTQYARTDLAFNFSLNSSYDFNCSLYLNSSVTNQINGTVAGNNVFLEFNETMSNGDHSYYVTCANNGTSETSTTNYFFVDTLIPTITAGNNLASNESSVQGDNNLTDQINFTDESIYFINISLNGTVLWNQSNLGVSEYHYNLSYNVSGFAGGQYNITATVCDGHTDNKVGFTGKRSGKVLLFDSTKVYAKDSTLVESVKTQKEKDRWTFEFETKNTPPTEMTFVVESDSEISVVSNSRYKAHLIILNERKWIDFETELKGLKYTVNQISPYKVEVKVKGMKNKKTKFRSIGNLNCQNSTYLWTKIGTSTVYDVDVLEYATINLTLNTTYPSGTLNITGRLFINHTWYNASVNNDGTYYYLSMPYTVPSLGTLARNDSFFWNYTIVQAATNTSYTTSNATARQYRPSLSNCSYHPTRSANFSILDFATGLPVNSSVEMWIEYWTGSSYTYNYSEAYTSENKTYACIYPHWANVTADIWMEYSETGTTKFNYFTYNSQLTNISRAFNMYIINGTNTVTFTVLDSDYEPVEGVFINVMQFDIGSGTYTTDQVLKTDSNGVALGQIILNTVWYKFILNYQGVQVLSTSPIIITSTSKTFRIDITTDVFDDLNAVRNATGEVIFYNTTDNYVVFEYNDPYNNIKEGCLRVTEKGYPGDSIVYDECILGSSGTLTYTIGNNTGDNTFIGVGFAKMEDGSEYIMDVASYTFDELWREYGLGGLFISFLLIVTLVMIGIWNPIISVVMMILGFFVSYTFGWFHLTPHLIITFVILSGITIYKLGRER